MAEPAGDLLWSDLPLVARAFLARPAEEVAPQLLGCTLVSTTPDGTVAVRLTEVEAYAGESDPGSHAYRGPTPRTTVMFGPPGHLYVYFSYGMHWCANVVCEQPGTAAAVLLRAGEVVDGEALARERRGPRVPTRDLARGPARLTKSLGIDRGANGTDVVGAASALRLHEAPRGAAPAAQVLSGPRTGVGGAGAPTPWRFWLDGDETVSAYRAHVPRQRTAVRGGPD